MIQYHNHHQSCHWQADSVLRRSSYKGFTVMYRPICTCGCI